MDSSGNIDLLIAFKKLLAENKSQEARLEEYAQIINGRNTEIDLLQKMLSETNEYRSTMDNAIAELKELRRYINDMQPQSAETAFLLAGGQQQENNTVSMKQQFESLKSEHADLQIQLTDLQMQLLGINNRNLLLIQQTSRFAELESLLENAEEEINKLKEEGRKS